MADPISPISEDATVFPVGSVNATMASLWERTKALTEEARKVAREEIARMAREVMKNNPTIVRFSMCNYDFWFDEIGEFKLLSPINAFDPRVVAVADFIGDWNPEFGLTLYPMRINGPDGDLLTEWRTD